METDITIKLTKEQLEKGLKEAVEAIFKSSYSNPFKDVIEKELKDKEGEFRTMFSQIMSEVMSKPEFKEKLGDLAMQALIQSALKK